MTADGREKFGTYTRDNPGQDYADQRYYNSNAGSFFSPDPRRNAELHTGEEAFAGLGTSSWLPQYYASCKVLLASMGKELSPRGSLQNRP